MTATDDAKADTFFAIVIGTGFAGAVTACRLVEAGHRICVLERGRRYGPNDFPKYPTEDLFVLDKDQQEHFAPPPDFSRWLWERDQGIYDIRDLDDAISVQAAGYGGGSLIYANVHLRPPKGVFDDRWPDEYRPSNGGWSLDPYFDLAAHMLRVSPIPVRLAKTLQLKRAAEIVDESTAHWFRTPLAINFEEHNDELAGKRHACDMRARCDLGCDIQAKNTLDLNYLLRAERGSPSPDIRTLAEVTSIERSEEGFIVTYQDVLLRADQASSGICEQVGAHRVEAKYVFLCAGALNTTELLLRNACRWDTRLRDLNADPTPLGSHYFPNADSLAAVFDCDQPHEADYGPTITSALLFQRPEAGGFKRSLDFRSGRLAPGQTPPVAGAVVAGKRSGAIATLVHNPVLDWGRWSDSDSAAAGLLVIDEGNQRPFADGEPLEIGEGQATATLRAPERRQDHWFLAEDGGYPPTAMPLAGIFRSPFWLRRNRYLEPDAQTPTTTSQRRAPARRLRVESFRESFAGTAKRAPSAETFFDRSLDPSRFRTDLLADQLTTLFPQWFVDAIANDKNELMAHAGAFALPLLGKLLDNVAETVAGHVDAETLGRLDLNAVSSRLKREVLVRGLLRQGLQILAGSEDAIATKAVTALLDPIPDTPVKLLELLGDVLLWALAYGETEGHTGIILVQGRDLHRGRLAIVDDTHSRDGRLRAWLPGRLLDTSSVMQERVLRVIASKAWHGELRTNPAWAVLGKRLTVHNQGGCPMGRDKDNSVTDAWGEVHDCPGLYVMDAAAFPTSVGVNPSAAIMAIAEFKIEQFIRKHAANQSWSAREKSDAAGWVDRHGREELDPLNHRDARESAEPALGVLGLTFEEVLAGTLSRAESKVKFEDLDGFPGQLGQFTKAEDAGAGKMNVEARLKASVDDLARLITQDKGVLPAAIRLTGTVKVTELRGVHQQAASIYRVEPGSFLQIFVQPNTITRPPSRFFRYELALKDESSTATLSGLKVLRDAPGFDAWNDTSVLYFDLIGDQHLRGVMRMSVEDFLKKQLPSIEITGTSDTARKSWALGAFYKYFASEIATVYVKRADALKDFFRKLLTTINV